MKLKNNALQELYETLVSGNPTISPHAESPIDKAFRECDEELQKDIDIWKCGNEILLSANSDLASIKKKLEKEIEKLKDLHDRNNILEKSNGTLLGANMDLCSENRDLKNRIEQLKKDLDDAKSSVQYFRASRNDMERRAKLAEEEIEELKEELKESQKDYDELTSQYQKLTIENKKLQDGLREIGYDQGQTELWDALQNVRDVNLLEEFDPECETLGDIIDMDLEDFLDTYKKWQEERKKVAEEAKKKHIEYMRSYLKRYCIGRLCINCPLRSTVSSCLFSRLTDEEVEKRYRTVIESNNNIATPISARPPQPWECTIEAKVEINKDLLEKVCGVKPEEEEHKLEYGDAVRLVWRNYDYMYIGPDEEEETIVRMFDPKNHAIATSHIGNVKYSGYKIILTNEEDLRKIWKYKK